MEVHKLWLQEETVNEVDFENNLFEFKDKNNPDPERLVGIGKGKYALKPKQCHCCLELFTPEDDNDNFCINCKEKGFTMDDIKLKTCANVGCSNEFKPVNNSQKFCASCKEKRKKEYNKKYMEKTRNEKIIKDLHPQLLISIPEKQGFSFNTIIETFLNHPEFESVTFNMTNGSSFKITKDI